MIPFSHPGQDPEVGRQEAPRSHLSQDLSLIDHPSLPTAFNSHANAVMNAPVPQMPAPLPRPIVTTPLPAGGNITVREPPVGSLVPGKWP
jgi:hypothetical protein